MLAKKHAEKIYSIILLCDVLPTFQGHMLSVRVFLVQVMTREMPIQEEKRRMKLELNDYPGSGANNRHDPRSPGKP